MPQIFPYGITLQQDGKLALFPAAEVKFVSQEGNRLSLFLVIDSGATISALPQSDAAVLGIDPTKGTSLTIHGIGGVPLQGWRHELRVRLGNEELTLPFVFLNHDETPRVLGRDGIFDRFTVVLEETRRRTAFLKIGDFEESRVKELIDGVQDQAA